MNYSMSGSQLPQISRYESRTGGFAFPQSSSVAATPPNIAVENIPILSLMKASLTNETIGTLTGASWDGIFSSNWRNDSSCSSRESVVSTAATSYEGWAANAQIPNSARASALHRNEFSSQSQVMNQRPSPTYAPGPALAPEPMLPSAMDDMSILLRAALDVHPLYPYGNNTRTDPPQHAGAAGHEVHPVSHTSIEHVEPPRPRASSSRSRVASARKSSSSRSTGSSPRRSASPRNVQVFLSPEEIEAIVESGSPVCPVEKCGHVQRKFRAPEMKRHLKTHCRGLRGEMIVCCGVPMEHAAKYEIPPRLEPFNYNGMARLGGCLKTFSRSDAYVRHLKKGRCFGETGWAQRVIGASSIL